MRRKPNLWSRTEGLEQRRPKSERWRTAWDLDALSDADLEALLPCPPSMLSSVRRWCGVRRSWC